MNVQYKPQGRLSSRSSPLTKLETNLLRAYWRENNAEVLLLFDPGKRQQGMARQFPHPGKGLPRFCRRGNDAELRLLERAINDFLRCQRGPAIGILFVAECKFFGVEAVGETTDP